MNPIIAIAVFILLTHLLTLKIFCRQRKKEHPLMDKTERNVFMAFAVGGAILILYDLGTSMNGILVASALPVIIGHIVGMNGIREASVVINK